MTTLAQYREQRTALMREKQELETQYQSALARTRTINERFRRGEINKTERDRLRNATRAQEYQDRIKAINRRQDRVSRNITRIESKRRQGRSTGSGIGDVEVAARAEQRRTSGGGGTRTRLTVTDKGEVLKSEQVPVDTTTTSITAPTPQEQSPFRYTISREINGSIVAIPVSKGVYDKAVQPQDIPSGSGGFSVPASTAFGEGRGAVTYRIQQAPEFVGPPEPQTQVFVGGARGAPRYVRGLPNVNDTGLYSGSVLDAAFEQVRGVGRAGRQRATEIAQQVPSDVRPVFETVSGAYGALESPRRLGALAGLGITAGSTVGLAGPAALGSGSALSGGVASTTISASRGLSAAGVPISTGIAAGTALYPQTAGRLLVEGAAFGGGFSAGLRASGVGRTTVLGTENIQSQTLTTPSGRVLARGTQTATLQTKTLFGPSTRTVARGFSATINPAPSVSTVRFGRTATVYPSGFVTTSGQPSVFGGFAVPDEFGGSVQLQQGFPLASTGPRFTSQSKTSFVAPRGRGTLSASTGATGQRLFGVERVGSFKVLTATQQLRGGFGVGASRGIQISTSIKPSGPAGFLTGSFAPVRPVRPSNLPRGFFSGGFGLPPLAVGAGRSLAGLGVGTGVGGLLSAGTLSRGSTSLGSGALLSPVNTGSLSPSRSMVTTTPRLDTSITPALDTSIFQGNDLFTPTRPATTTTITNTPFTPTPPITPTVTPPPTFIPVGFPTIPLFAVGGGGSRRSKKDRFRTRYRASLLGAELGIKRSTRGSTDFTGFEVRGI